MHLHALTSPFALLLLLLAAGACWVLGQLGWLTPRQPWAAATGWNRIPEARRPHAATPAGSGAPFIRWLGHSGFVLRWDDTLILLDPNVNARCTVTRRIMELPALPSRLGRVDAALISHGHYDHLDVFTLASIPGLQSILLPKGSEVFLKVPALSRIPVHPLALGETRRVGSLEIRAVPAAHNGNRYHPWRSPFLAVGYVIRNAAGRSLYFAGDTAFANDWSTVRDALASRPGGQPPLAILPIGAYAPRSALQRHHMNPEEAVAAARTLGVPHVIPCHMGTFRLSFDRPASALPRFARAATAAGLTWSMPVLLRASDLPACTATPEGQPA